MKQSKDLFKELPIISTCTYQNCEITHDKGLIDDANALLIDHNEIKSKFKNRLIQNQLLLSIVKSFS